MRNRYFRTFALALALGIPTGMVAVTAPACGRLAAPAQLSPLGDTAFYARRLTAVIKEAQQVTIEGEKAGAFTGDDVREVGEATKIAGQGAIDLANILQAGGNAAEGKARVVAIIRKALEDLPQRLSPQAQKLIGSFVQTALVLLTAFE